MRKVVLITGCSSGFGYKMALKFAQNGCMTYASVRNCASEGAKALEKRAKKEKLSLEVVELDVCNDKSVMNAVRYILKKERRIDILINNAGYGYLGPIEQTPIADVKALYETNIFGILRMTQAVLPIMRKQHRGLIINVSSINGIVPFPLFSIYSSTKFAIETITEGLRFELKHFGIHVVVVEPGSYLTNFSKNRKQPKNLLRPPSPYRQLLDTFFVRYNKTHDIKNKDIVLKTADPQEVADAVFAIAKRKNPQLRYRIGLDANKYYYLRKFLPFFVWEWLLRKAYQW